jgi:putative glutamine amidotransferase
MPPLIAIPEPVSNRTDYNQRALPQYIQAIEKAGAKARIILFSTPLTEAAHIMTECDAVLLPGSPADVDPQKYQAAPDPRTAAADQARDAVDAALLRGCYEHRKPVLGICYGLQSLNVWRAGSLVQHIESRVNHEAGRTVLRAHRVEVAPFSRLAAILSSGGQSSALVADNGVLAEVNSSHHQAAADIGDGLRAVATCPDDGVIEAIEGTAPDHFVLAVQWHPERTTETEESSRAIFRAFVQAAAGSNHH